MKPTKLVSLLYQRYQNILIDVEKNQKNKKLKLLENEIEKGLLHFNYYTINQQIWSRIQP